MKKPFSWLFGAACCGVLISINNAFAQGTAFTYQGRLSGNGSPVTGQYDLTFALYTVSSGGGAAFGPITNTATAVSNGLFTATLDFGAGVFNGTTYWLDIAVRTNGTGVFANLTPRQQLTPSPYAVYSPSAGTAATAASVAATNIIGTISAAQLSSAVVTNNEGNVTLTGAFAGNGANLTNIPFSGLASSSTLNLATNGLDFVLSSSLVVGLGPAFVASGTNLNGAGHVDLAVANYFAGTLTVLTNNGSGRFSTEAVLTVQTNPFSIAVADVNNDGRPDIICSYYNLTSTNLTVLTNNGAGGFGSNATLTVGLSPTCVIAADVNGDGKPDLITANYGTNTLTVLTNNGNGGFSLSATVKVGISPTQVIAADLIGNGKQDLVCANNGTNTLSVLINNGNGTFLPTTYTVGNTPRSVVALDVNGDGLLDLVCGSEIDGSLSVLTNNGDGTFTAANTVTNLLNNYIGTINYLAAADMNGDGKQDIITANGVALVILLNTGNATFAPPIVLVPNLPFSSSYGLYGLAAVDVNGDGKPDLLTTDLGTNIVAEILNLDGQISSEMTLPGQGGGVRLLSGLNGDPNLIGGSSANVIDPGVDGSIIAGGGSTSNYNHISASQSVISGGEGNSIQLLSGHSVIGGGESNVIQSLADHSAIGGGSQNTILSYGMGSVISGGISNTAAEFCATVPGGYSNVAGGQYSFAAGRLAQAAHYGSFVWADASGTPFSSTANNQFSVRAYGGIRLDTGGTGTSLDGFMEV
ncbi:MAG TPA: FG-GAP-like repeat-containing protein, partial [Verrucomicrobiae bacterium]|nr:FG-GAP-like repeat-containing protein [Verrucomicrobiae bacterium]